MNPFIILLKLMLLVSSGDSVENTQQSQLDDFVVKKQVTYSPLDKLSIFNKDSKADCSGTIMQPVSTKQELAIFCKMEHELMKASGFAIKFRLGDQSFVDQLEGK